MNSLDLSDEWTTPLSDRKSSLRPTCMFEYCHKNLGNEERCTMGDARPIAQREPGPPFCEFLQAGSRTENHKGPRVYLHTPALSPLDTPAFLAELTTAAFAFPLHRSGPEAWRGPACVTCLGHRHGLRHPWRWKVGEGRKAGSQAAGSALPLATSPPFLESAGLFSSGVGDCRQYIDGGPASYEIL